MRNLAKKRDAFLFFSTPDGMFAVDLEAVEVLPLRDGIHFSVAGAVSLGKGDLFKYTQLLIS